MAVVEHFSDEHSEAKLGSNFIRTDDTLPRITGVFTARRGACFIPYNSNAILQQSAAQPFEKGPAAGDRFREVNRVPWSRVGLAFEYDRNVIKPIPEVSPSSATVAAKDNNSFVCSEPGFFPTHGNFIPDGGLLPIDAHRPKTGSVLGKDELYQADNPERCCGDEQVYTTSDRWREMHPSCLSNFDCLQKSIPCRVGAQRDHFKEIVNTTFSETIELYKRAVKCSLEVQPLSPSYDKQGSINSKLIFSWEHIKRVLENDTCAELTPSFLGELIDLNTLTLISNRRKCNVGGALPISGVRSSSIKQTLAPSNDFVGCNPTAPSTKLQAQTQTQTQTKNVTSIPYEETHMEAILRSSTAQLHSHGKQVESQKHLLTPSLGTYHSVEVKEQEEDVYLGRYPCLRDIPYLSTKDKSDGRNTPSVSSSSEDSCETSPNIIIRPRPPLETYHDGFEYNREEFQSYENFSNYHPLPQTVDSTFAPDLELAPRTTSPTTEMPSLPSNDTPDNSGLNPNWRYSTKSPLSKLVASTPSFHPIVPKSEGSEFTLATTATNGSLSRQTWKTSKKKPRKHPNHCLHLWEFLLDLLNNEEYSPKYIAWTRKDIGEFKLIRTEFIANLWGQSKRRKKMTYEKMARALRYYYKFNVLEKVPHKRLHFRFGKSILPRIFNLQPAQKDDS